MLPPPTRVAPDALTQDVMRVVNDKLVHHPGSIAQFGWPVTREHALAALHAFIKHRLPYFGQYQDAMWEGEVWLFHSHLSCALNYARNIFLATESSSVNLFCWSACCHFTSPALKLFHVIIKKSSHSATFRTISLFFFLVSESWVLS
jgi:hypothetical protein